MDRHTFDRQLKTMFSRPISIEITPVKSLKSTCLPTQKYISRSIYLHHKVNAMRLILSQSDDKLHAISGRYFQRPITKSAKDKDRIPKKKPENKARCAPHLRIRTFFTTWIDYATWTSRCASLSRSTATWLHCLLLPVVACDDAPCESFIALDVGCSDLRLGSSTVPYVFNCRPCIHGPS